MAEESFAKRWRSKERAMGLKSYFAKMIKCGDTVLPDSAAPCLTFTEASNPLPIWKLFGVPADWTKAKRRTLDPFLVIGSDGAGNPICIQQTTGEVVLLDHEDSFNSVQFVTSSVGQLAECILAYFGESDPERFRSTVAELDKPAIAEGTFWWHEASNIGVEW